MWTYGTITYQYLLKLIDVSLIIYMLICNFIHMPFVRHPVQMLGECGKNAGKNIEINKTSHFLFGICYL